MIGTRKLARAVALLALAAALPAAAQNLNFLRSSALAAMSADDRREAAAAFRAALDAAADGETREWANAQTGAGGALEPIRSYHDALIDLDCREARLMLKAGGREEQGRYYLCKAPDGRWKFTRPPGFAR